MCIATIIPAGTQPLQFPSKLLIYRRKFQQLMISALRDPFANISEITLSFWNGNLFK